MKTGNILFVLIVLGYFALEAYVASRVAYRMEPDYIFSEYVTAARAVELCGSLKPVDAENFQANYNYVKQRAIDAEEQPTESSESTGPSSLEQEAAGRREVEALVDELGCKDIELFKLRKRYENLARQNLPTPKR